MASSTETLKIPSTLFEVYWQYKTSTATVLGWLSEHGAFTSPSGLELDQLQLAAENAVAKNVIIPEVIHHAFRESVAKRWKVTNWFISAERRTGGEKSRTTLKHIYYTERLEEAFSTLFPNRENGSSHRSIGKRDNEAAQKESHNRFEHLSELVPESIISLIIDEIEEAALIPSQHAKELTAASKDVVFQDDPLEDLIRIYLLLREMDSICETVQDQPAEHANPANGFKFVEISLLRSWSTREIQ